ncbi:L,D-transpeptidase family protein [Defluviitalea saccharophila]|uniref:L,D-transpeptidase family protein n=1 Tax=Defluviitalea saccharophila TaxID=879970 RepID=A0ABZ2Y372_9FIRM|nr:L,D-transpeptidase family protein [Candidatus Epulonipiscium sp.]
MVLLADLRKHINVLFILLILAGILLFFQHYNLLLVDVKDNTAVIRVNFLVPMEQYGIEKNLEIKSSLPNTKFQCDLKWEGPNRLKVTINELSELKGQKILFKIHGAKSQFPFLHKSLSTSVQFQAEPQLLEIENKDHVPTEGPLVLQFNTPMDAKNIQKFIQSDVKFDLEPQVFEDDGKSIDYSRWNLYPKEKMNNESNYLLLIKKGLKAQCGHMLKEDIQIQIRTASKPKIVETNPKQSAQWVALYPKISAKMNEEIKDAVITIDGVKQKVSVKDNKLEFLPHKILDPGEEYEVSIQGISKYGEKTDPYVLKFMTMPINDDDLWVEVSLKGKHEVIIHKGKDIIRRMPASGGTKEEPTVLGTFFIQDRGTSFFSKRFNEGATYWVRIIDQYLFHGIPRDNHWNIIESERKKIGKPASHGCVRMNEEDAKWFYENIPHGTMVIIHE